MLTGSSVLMEFLTVLPMHLLAISKVLEALMLCFNIFILSMEFNWI